MRYVSDAVWNGLDPRAGRLGPRAARAVRIGTVAVVVALLLTPLVWRSGLVVPRVGWPNSGGYGSSAEPGRITQDLVVHNYGWTPVTVVGVGRSGPGLELVRVWGLGDRMVVRPGETLQLHLDYRVVDCAAVTADPWPVPVRVARPWGTWTAYVPLPPEPPEGVRTYAGRDPAAVEWQRNLADLSCSSG